MKFIEYTSPTNNKTFLINIDKIEQIIAIAGRGKSTIYFAGEKSVTLNIEYSDLKEMIQKASK